MSDNIKQVTDGLAALAAVATVAMEWMPQIAALFAVIWYIIRLYEYARLKLSGEKYKDDDVGGCDNG